MNSSFVPAVGHLGHIKTYVRADKPLLFSAANEFGDLYLVSFAELTDEGERWFMVQVTRDELRAVENGQVDIRSAFLNAQAGSIISVEYLDEDQPPKLGYYRCDDAEALQFLAIEGKKLSLASKTFPPIAYRDTAEQIKEDVAKKTLYQVRSSGFSFSYTDGVQSLEISVPRTVSETFVTKEKAV